MEDIEKEIEEEFCDVGIDIEGNLIILEKRKLKEVILSDWTLGLRFR